jgi:signal transduction histidine kinase
VYGHQPAGDPPDAARNSPDLAGGPPRRLLARALSERRWRVTTVVAACAGLAILDLAMTPYPAGRALRLILVVLALGAVALVPRWPLPVFAVTAAGAGLVMTSGHGSLGLAMMTGLASYFAASRLPRRVSIGAAVAAAAVFCGPLAYAAIAVPGASPAAAAVQGFAPLAAGWFVGDSVQARRRYLAGLADQAERERAAEAERARQQVVEERMRIARELHDVVAHTLAVITVQAGVGRRLMAKRPEEASTALESIETIGRTAQDELRVVLGLLRDEAVGPAALAPAPTLVDLKELAENVRASGTPVDLLRSGAGHPLSPALELSIYRVVQEALTNVVKHAPGARASVDLTISRGRVRLEVADDGGSARRSPEGAGADGTAGLGTGHGIVGMRERVAAFGGWLVAERLVGGGFRVLAEIPVEAVAGSAEPVAGSAEAVARSAERLVVGRASVSGMTHN